MSLKLHIKFKVANFLGLAYGSIRLFAHLNILHQAAKFQTHRLNIVQGLLF